MSFVNFDEIRSKASGALEKGKGAMEKAKFKLMRKAEDEANMGEDSSETPLGDGSGDGEEESQASSFMEDFTDTYCPTLTFQQVNLRTKRIFIIYGILTDPLWLFDSSIIFSLFLFFVSEIDWFWCFFWDWL